MMDLCQRLRAMIEDEESAVRDYELLREAMGAGPEVVLVDFIRQTERFHKELLEDLLYLYCQTRSEKEPEHQPDNAGQGGNA